MRDARQDAISNRAGFTLMEVLVAVALSSVIMIALFGMFNTVVDVASGVKLREDAAYGDRAFESILFDDLRSVFKDGGSDFAFDGKGGSFLGEDGLLMGFATTASLSNRDDGPNLSVQRVEYRVEGNDDEKVLYRRERVYCGMKGDWDWVEVPVLKGLEEIEVEYLNGFDNTFVTEWNGTKYPLSVRVALEYSGGRESEFLVELSTMAREAK